MMPAAPGAALTPRRVPEAYVRAEIASFPLVDPAAFEHSMVELNPELDQTRGRTQDLWRRCEAVLSEHASGWSLDRLILARDYFWFGQTPDRRRAATRPVSMRKYLHNLAEGFLEPHSGVTWLAQGRDSNTLDASTHYRWLTFALPEDLLLAASPVEPPPIELGQERPVLMQHLLDVGVAEIHQHVGAGMDFSILWASLLARLADPTLPRGAMQHSPALPLGGGAVLMQWLLAAAVVRCVLAEFLVRREEGSRQGLDGFLDELCTPPAWPSHRRRLLGQTMQALGRGDAARLPDFNRLHDLYMQLHPMGATLPGQLPETLEALWRQCDPIAVRLKLSTPNGGERWLLRHGLRYLEELEQRELEWRVRERQGAFPHQEDFLFPLLFWQSLRVRCIYYRTVVQRPMTSGLQWFVRFYDRLAWVRDPLWKVRAQVSYQVAGRGRPLRALEVRISPKDTSFDLADDLLALLTSWTKVIGTDGSARQGQLEPEFGVLAHINKQRDPRERWASGVPPAGERQTHAEPRPEAEAVRLGGRFADFFSDQAVQARALVDLVRAVPKTLWLLRGLDVASDELGVPTWVLVPLYRYVHAEANLAAMEPEGMHRGQLAPPFRLTAHVGEDFRHLMEGLRRIFECMKYLLVGVGGRLGHATALGFEPRLWAESTGSVMMTVEERLWDLAVEWRLYSSYRIEPELRAEAPPGRPEQVENLIRDLSCRVFGKSYEAPVLAEAHHVLHQMMCHPLARGVRNARLDGFDRALEMVDRERVQNENDVLKLLRRYREHEGIFQRGQEPIDISLNGAEVEALYAVQNALRRAVGLRGLVVEVNPSSNLLIGDLLDLRNHPILRLFPPEPQEGVPPVPIAVGSDDPITFSTWLMHEYSLLSEAAMTAGYPERTVHEWLGRIQQMGLDARFSVAWRPSASELAAELECNLCEYLRRPVPVSRQAPCGRRA